MSKSHVKTVEWNHLQKMVIKDNRLMDSPCFRCGQPIDYELSGNNPAGPTVDHMDPMALGGNVMASHDRLAVSHQRCNAKHGAQLGNRLRGRQLRDAAHIPGEVEDDEDPWDPSKYVGDGGIFVGVEGGIPDVWLECEWVQPLLVDIPDTATWPRLMTGPHPEATGSYGELFVGFIERRRQQDALTPERAKPLRWWQKLVVYRMYEHDKFGNLVWRKVLVSTSRQVGKSVALREIALQRMSDHRRYGEPQLVLHVAKDLGIADEIQRPARQWANMIGGVWHGVGGNGRWAVEYDGVLGRWIVRSQLAVYGYSASLALIDEAWAIDKEHINEGIEPTMIEREQSQMLMVSTAHREATSLFPELRITAMENIDSPKDDVVLIEWSAPPNADKAHVAAHRMASPYWDERRAKFILSKVKQAGFAEQWLNIWPDTAGQQKMFAPRETIKAAILEGLTIKPTAEARTYSVYADADQIQWHVLAACVEEENIMIQYVGVYRTARLAINAVMELVKKGSPADLVIPRVLRGRIPRLSGIRTTVMASESDVAAATTTVRPLLLAGKVRHDGHEVLVEQMSRAVLDTHGETVRISSKESEGNVEAAKAAVLAGWWASRQDKPRAVVV